MTLVRWMLSLTPHDRFRVLQEHQAALSEIDAVREREPGGVSEHLLGALVGGEVRFILVGGVAAVFQGVSTHTFDVDIVQARDRENARRLSVVLRSLEACYREHLPKRIEPREEDLTQPGHHLLWTRLGPLDVLGEIVGKRGYEDLIDRAPLTDLGRGLRAHVLDLEVIVETKELLGREKDRAQLPEYRRTLEERRKRGG